MVHQGVTCLNTLGTTHTIFAKSELLIANYLGKLDGVWYTQVIIPGSNLQCGLYRTTFSSLYTGFLNANYPKGLVLSLYTSSMAHANYLRGWGNHSLILSHECLLALLALVASWITHVHGMNISLSMKH